MKHYVYKALQPDGSLVSATIAAGSRQAAAERLHENGLRLVSLRERRMHIFWRRPFSHRALALFAREWSSLLSAGLPPTGSLSLLSACRSRHSQAILSSISHTIASGRSLSDAFSQSGAFPPFFLALLAVGEMSGTLPEELTRLGTYYEKEADFRQKLLATAAYPLCLFGFVMTLFILILTVILPSFSLLFQSLAIPMPPATAVALQIGQVLSSWGGFLLFCVALSVAALYFLFSGKTGTLRRDRILFHLQFPRRLFLIRLCHTLAALLQSGRPLSEALCTAAPLLGNQDGALRLLQVQKDLSQGSAFPESLQRRGLSSPILHSMISAGMESGELPAFLSHAARLLTEEMERKLALFKTLLGPALIIMAGLMTAAVLFTIMIPLLTAIGKMGN